MVGAGLHFSYAGLIEEFKAVRRAAGDNKRRTSDRDTAASCLHMAARQFKTIFTGAQRGASNLRDQSVGERQAACAAGAAWGMRLGSYTGGTVRGVATCGIAAP